MAELFGRRSRVSIGELAAGDVVGEPSVGGSSIPVQLRIAFKIERDRRTEPNKAEAQIYNLSKESRAKIKKGDLLTISAGYVDSFGQIFQGDVRTISHVQNGPDWITKLTAGDGETAHRTKRVSESFGPNTRVSAVLKKLVEAYGVKIGNANKVIEEKAKINQYLRGRVLTGKVSDQLERILAENGLEYSIQDGALQVVEIGKAVDSDAVLLSSDSGLVGSPETGELGKDGKTVIKIKSLMQPKIVPGRLIDLDSVSLKGVVRADKVRHTGDTYATSPWFTEIDGALL